MKHRLFEDQQDTGVDRQISGIGPGAKNPGEPGGMNVGDFLQQRNQPPQSWKDTPYPLNAIDESVADVFVDLSNISKMLDIAKANPVLDKKTETLDKLNSIIIDMAKNLVDFNEKLSIIKGDE